MSGRVNTLPPKKIFDQADMSSTLTSEEISFEHLGGFSIDIDWTTTDINGTFEVQVSNGLTWHTIPEAQFEIQGTLAGSGASGTGYLNVPTHMGYKFRLRFVPSSGSDGTVTAVMGGKML